MSSGSPSLTWSAQSPLLVVHWVNPDGSSSAGYPLPPGHAEALVQAFRRFYPRQVFWTETPGAMTAGAAAVRDRRPRRR